ncbi:MAG: PAS domain-containing protein [Pseudorhodoferax sp.]
MALARGRDFFRRRGCNFMRIVASGICQSPAAGIVDEHPFERQGSDCQDEEPVRRHGLTALMPTGVSHGYQGGPMPMPSRTEEAVHLLETADVDALDVGVIGFDAAGLVRVYNRFESRAAGLSQERVIGMHVFDTVAPCMNNFLVAQRFEDAAARHEVLDVEIDYVLTLRMKPTAVRLRLLAWPGAKYRYILVSR